MRIQLIVIGIALALAVVVVLVLMGVLPGLRDREADRAVVLNMWSFQKENESFHEIIVKYREEKPNVSINYQQKNLENFESDFLNVLARGGKDIPDIIVFPSDYLKSHGDKLSPAPSLLITEREVSQQYIDAANNFLTPKKEVLGLPLYAEPLLLYWNKDLFSQNFITLPPATWDEFLADAQKITKKDNFGNILISGAALGRAINIKNSALILTTLMLQSGEKIIDENGEVVLGSPIQIGNTAVRPAESALRFVSDLANAGKSAQSWSGTLPEAKDFFIAGKLAMYLGTPQEFNEIKERNPHLNFAVSALPQLKNTSPITSGVLYALSSPKASAKQQQAWGFIIFLTGSENSSEYGKFINNVSLRRDVLPAYQADSIKSVFAKSVLNLRLWPDSNPKETAKIFERLIENVSSGKITIREALDKAKAELSEL